MNWSNFPFQNNSSKLHHSSSMEYMSHGEPLWVEDLLQSPLETPVKKAALRRSASDSLAFPEAPANSTNENDKFEVHPLGSTSSSRISPDFNRLDEKQLMSILSDTEPYQKAKNQPDESSLPAPTLFEGACPEKQTPITTTENLSSPSDHNSIVNEPSVEDNRMNGSEQLKNEPEVQSACKGDQPVNPVKTEPPASMSLEANMDPKRIKRIIANRQSAQRSRVRKLHYISELERSVNALQTEVSTISPQVAYLDHQRAILKIDNSTLKERIAALVQDKIFKDAQSELLKAEVQMLRQLYQQQRMEQEMAPTVSFDMHRHQFGKLEMGPCLQEEPRVGVSDTLTDILRSAEGNFDNKRNTVPQNHCTSVSHMPNGLIPTAHLLTETNKNFEDRMMAGNTPFSSDYMTQNR